MRAKGRSVFFPFVKNMSWLLWSLAFVRVRVLPNAVPMAVGGVFPVTIEVCPKPYHNFVLTLGSSDTAVVVVPDKIVGKANSSSLTVTVAAQGLGNTKISVAVNPGGRFGARVQGVLKAVATLVGLGNGQSQCTVERPPILIVAPHPDDEALMTSGVIAHAVQDGQPVKVALVTNGDHRKADREYGLRRQTESANAMRTLGLQETDLIFLGYPGDVVGLLQMMNNYLTPDVAYTSVAEMSETYGARGLGSRDFHSWATGKPAAYNAPNLQGDLETLIRAWRPLHIYTTSRFDEHPDHRAVYYFVVRATQCARLADFSYAPTLHTTVIHDITPEPYNDFWEQNNLPSTQTVNFDGDDHWPQPALSTDDPETVRFDASMYFSEPPNLTRTGLCWSAVESVPVPSSMDVAAAEENLKYQVLVHYTSQQLRYLAPFCKRDEIFWTEQPSASELLILSPVPQRIEAGRAAVLALTFVKPVTTPRAIALTSSDEKIVSVPSAVIVSTGTVTVLFAGKAIAAGTAVVSAHWDTPHIVANITVTDTEQRSMVRGDNNT